MGMPSLHTNINPNASHKNRPHPFETFIDVSKISKIVFCDTMFQC
jgi:hypothetical protein